MLHRYLLPLLAVVSSAGAFGAAWTSPARPGRCVERIGTRRVCSVSPITVPSRSSQRPDYWNHQITPSPSALHVFSFFEAADPDLDLVVGFATIAAACSPYTLSLLLPDFFNDNFFLPIYKTETADEALAAREAEIGWKVRYTTLALALTTLSFAEVVWFPDNSPTTLLRDSYYLWTIFYLDAALKIVREYQKDMLAQNRGFIQAWHLLVALILIADTSTSPRAEAFIEFIKDIFTF